VPRETIRDWRHGGRSGRVLQARLGESCPICGPAHLDEGEYAYLLGLYLGDGCLSEHRGGVFNLRISLDSRQPMIIEECARSVAMVARGRLVSRQAGRGCTIVGAYWNRSGDIQQLFRTAGADFGVSRTQPSFKELSVAKARDVARLDAVIGLKR
jgi:hypothetical protein